MTPPQSSPRKRGAPVRNTTTITNSRDRHSSSRAALQRKYRDRFNQYRKVNASPTGSRAELASWDIEMESAAFDSTVINLEEKALLKRENKSIVPRIGNLAQDRPDGVWRIAYCQLNNISGSDVRRRKLKSLAEVVEEFDVDGISLCEVGVNWNHGRGHSLKSWSTPYFTQEIKCTTANNIHGPKVSLSQPGGTGIILTQSLFEYARETESDPRGLGRWTSWKLAHVPEHTTRIVVAYCPCTGTNRTGLKTVHRQHLNYIQSENIDRTPYQLFFDDLIAQLRKWRCQNERLILCIDLNEHSLNGKIARRLRSDDIELNECTHSFWPDQCEPNTHIDGSQPIDGIFATPDIDVTNCLLLSFHESIGDHRTAILEFTTKSAIGRYQGKIVRPSSRRLTLRQPGAVKSYNSTIHEQFNIHCIPQRLALLLKESTQYQHPPPISFRTRCENIHKQIAEIRHYAESTCRKLLKPALEFSPTVQYWYDRAHAYIQLIKIKSGTAQKHADVSRAMRFAIRKDIPNPRALTLDQCKDGLKLCRIRQKELRRVSTSLRRQFGHRLVDHAHASGDMEREKAIKERMQRERSSSTWKRINRVTRPSKGRSCREIQRDINGNIITFTTKQSVEQHIQEECSSRFHLGHSAPIASTLLGDELQYLHDIDIAYSILMGTYAIPDKLDPATKLLLSEIAKLGKATLTGASAKIVISGEDYTKYWNRINDRTSSSPSGLHITHYKATALDPILAEHFALQMNLIMESGIHPLRWGIALQVMLEKVAGVCLVDKLRSIQLYEADLNWFMKFVFNDLALSKLDEADMLPEEHYSKKDSTAEDACLDKTLTFDISRQSRSPMATISVDAAQCYDRVHPALMSLVWLALTNHPHSVIILLHVLQQMKIFTRTGFGDSSSHFGGPDEIPMCGLGQGSKAAPASWLQLSSMIVNAYKDQDCASAISDPITGDIIRSVGCMFVDDTDLYSMGPALWSIVLVALQAQACVSLWSNLLKATGGAIKGSKSFWYLVGYKCRQGRWEYDMAEMNNHDLLLTETYGKTTILERKLPTDAIRTLGVYHSPEGDHSFHLSQMHDRAYTWLNCIRNGHLPSNLVLMSYYQQLWAGLRYGLGALSNSYAAAENCLTKFDYQLLPYIGVNRNIKKEWRNLHSTFGGIGLLSLPIEQFISRTTMLLQHYNTTSIIGKKLTCSLHLLQLQLGTNENPFLLSYKRFGHLAPHSWASRYWESIEHFPIRLFLEYNSIALPRRHDTTIMSFLDQYMPTTKIIMSINRCRCYLNLLFLSDIATADGKCIDQDLLSRDATPRTSSYSFPPEFPTRDDWYTWSDVWRSALGYHGTLPQPLGEWLHSTHIIWTWSYDTRSDHIVQNCGSHLQIFKHDTKLKRITRSSALYSRSQELFVGNPSDLLPATCAIIPSFRSEELRVSIKSIGPSLSLPNKLPSSFWDVLEQLGGSWMWSNIHFDFDASVDWFLMALSHGSLVWVTDGSHNPTLSPDLSGAGWIVKDITTNRQWACSFFEVSSHANSYRAELLGLLSIHTFILALSKYYVLLNKSTVELRCDNKGALRTSSRKLVRIRPSSKCADILRCFRSLHKQLNNVHIHYAHVAAHMDDVLQWDDLTIEQQLNVQCDLLAKKAVTMATKELQEGNQLPSTDQLPLEQCAIYIDNQKLSSDISNPLRFECSKIKAKNFLCSRRGWNTHQFDEVDWKSLDTALSSKTMGFRIWLAKQHSNFCASRVQLFRCRQSDDDKCPSCLLASENADHLCRCPNAERIQLLHDSTADLEKWMETNNNTHHELCYWIPKYIKCRGEVKFVDLGPMSPTMHAIAESQDRIGWRNFMEGRISTKITSLQRNHLILSNSRLPIKSWSSRFISMLLHITHSQWIFRNFMLHDNAMGYLRLKEHTDAAIQIDSLMQHKPSSIPPESQFLLEFDVERLLFSDIDTQHYWLAAMNAAVAAKQQQPPTLTQPQPIYLRPSNRYKAASTIRQIRQDINRSNTPAEWIISPHSVSGPSPATPRPTPHWIQLTLPSNKKRKPD